jgi:WD40 repeat protein
VARFLTPAAAKEAKSRQAVLFEPASGKELGQIILDVDFAAVHRKPIHFSPDRTMLAVNTGNERELIALYDVPTAKLLRTLDAGPVDLLGKGRGGPWGAGGFPGGPGGIIGPRGRAGSFGQRMLFSSDGKAIAFQAGWNSPIVVLDSQTGRQIAAIDEKVRLQGVFTPDNRCLALEKDDGTVTLYELATGQPRCTYGSPSAARPVIADDDIFDWSVDLGGQDRSKARVAVSPDGQLLVLGAPGGSVHIWSVMTGKELAALKGHTMAVNALAFAPGGKTMASASDDTTTLIWDMTRIARPELPVKALTAGALESCWQTVADNDAARAFTAMSTLIAAPADSVAWIKERVRPVPPLDVKRISDLMHQLNDDQFKVRHKATAELLKVGELVLPVVDKALASGPTPEARRRLNELKKKLMAVGLQGQWLRAFRAVEILERIGSPEARRALQALAKGAPEALLTTSAMAALKR